MSDPAAFTRELTGTSGRYVRQDRLAELTIPSAATHVWIADHTHVNDSLRGTGAGLALVLRLVADARVEGRRIIQLSPFVNAQRRKHPDWADAFQV